MLRITSGDLLYSGCDALVNTVNCVGVSGAGLAKQFARMYPQTDQAYKQECRYGLYYPGVVRPYVAHGQTLLYVATKDDWRFASKIEWVERGIKGIRELMFKLQLGSVAIPPMGAGLGRLDPDDVLVLVREYLGGAPFDVLYYATR